MKIDTEVLNLIKEMLRLMFRKSVKRFPQKNLRVHFQVPGMSAKYKILWFVVDTHVF